MAFGNDGNMYIYEVPPNLKNPQDSTDKTEEQQIGAFWKRESDKCRYVRNKRVERAEEQQEKQRIEEIRKAREEQLREMEADNRAAEEEATENAYFELKLRMQLDLKMITEDEFNETLQERKKPQR